MNQISHKILSLLGIEITNENDEQLLSQLPWDMDNKQGFSDTFHQDLMEQLFVHKESLETKIVQMFQRVAMPAAAAILLLFAINFSQLKTIDSLLETDEIVEWIEGSTDDWLDEL